MGTTKIQWTDKTWSPVHGCTKLSPGCKNCFAEVMANRQRAMGTKGYENGFAVTLCPERLSQPLKWRKPSMIFVCSMGDLFHDEVPFEFIAAVFGVMAATPRHTYQVLTKRPERMIEFFEWYEGESGAGASPMAALYEAASRIDDEGDKGQILDAVDDDLPWPLKNLWLGVTAEDQQRYDERIGILEQIPAHKEYDCHPQKFLSLEPLLGEIDLKLWNPRDPKSDGEWMASVEGVGVIGMHRPPGLVIAGCEKTGAGLGRPAKLDWFRSLRDQCVEVGTSFFLKQAAINGRLAKMPELDGRVWDQMPVQK